MERNVSRKKEKDGENRRGVEKDKEKNRKI
jgi:hypothetical protein